jgi:hypothetical protein
MKRLAIRPGSTLPSRLATLQSRHRLFYRPDRSSLSFCPPSLLHDRWRDWCQAATLSWGHGRCRLTKAPCPTSWWGCAKGAASYGHVRPMPPPRATAAVVERQTQRAMQTELISSQDQRDGRSADAREAGVGLQSADTIELNFIETQSCTDRAGS